MIEKNAEESALRDLSALRLDYEAGLLTKALYSRKIWGLHRRLFEYSEFLEGTNVDAIEINREGVVIRLRDPSLSLWGTPQDQRHVAIANLNFRQFESREIATVLRLAKSCAAFFDIGANVGLYSIAMGQSYPDSNVVAFEPIRSTYEELKRNLALNHVGNVTACNLGLSDYSHEAEFYFDPTVSGAASAAPLGPEFGATETVSCPVVTIDEFVEKTGVPPNFIKCDVEGGELGVFRGAVKTLEAHRPMIFAEMLRKWSARFGYHPNDMIGFFRDLGYDCFVLSGEILQPFLVMTEQTLETNFFFLHRREHLEAARSLSLLP